MEKVKAFFVRTWESILNTKLGKLILSFILAAISFSLSDIWEFMFWAGCAFMIYPLGLFCVMMAYAWVINPIRAWKESKKSKEMTAVEIADAIESKPESKNVSTEPAISQTPALENKTVKKSAKKTVKKTVVRKKITPKKNGKRRK